MIFTVLRIVSWPLRVVYFLCACTGFIVLLAIALLWFGIINFSDIPFSSKIAAYTARNVVAESKLGEAVGSAVDKISEEANATTLFYRGVAYYKAGKYDAALADFNKVLQLDGTNKKAIMYLGHCSMELDDLDTALTYYDLTLNGLTDVEVAAEVYLHQGRALQRQGKIKEAIHAYDQALIVKPGYTEASEARAAIGG